MKPNDGPDIGWSAGSIPSYSARICDGCGSHEGQAHTAKCPAVRSLVTEERIIDPNTGGAKGSKLARFDLVPWGIIREVAEHFGRGARKYEDRNWEKGYAWSLSFAALHRHLEAFWGRDEIDDDPSLYLEGEAWSSRHIIAVVWHSLVLAWFSRYHKGTDDRPSFGGTTPEQIRNRVEAAIMANGVRRASQASAPPNLGLQTGHSPVRGNFPSGESRVI